MEPIQIIIFVIILVLVIYLLIYIFKDKHTLQGLQNGQTTSTIAYASLATNGSSVPSANFTYSMWFYINDWNYRYGEEKVLFVRRNDAVACPNVFLTPEDNNLIISMSSGSGVIPIPNICLISNIPIQSWVNLLISVYSTSMDVYINGKLVKTLLLHGPVNVTAVQNENIYITPAGKGGLSGFDGWTSKFQYYPTSTNPQQAWNIYTKGYGNLSNLLGLGTYQLQVSVLENGSTQGSFTI